LKRKEKKNLTLYLHNLERGASFLFPVIFFFINMLYSLLLPLILLLLLLDIPPAPVLLLIFGDDGLIGFKLFSLLMGVYVAVLMDFCNELLLGRVFTVDDDSLLCLKFLISFILLVLLEEGFQ